MKNKTSQKPSSASFSESESFKLFNAALQTALNKGKQPNCQEF